MKKVLCFLSMACILSAPKETTQNSFSIAAANVFTGPALTSFMYASVFSQEPDHSMPLLSE